MDSKVSANGFYASQNLTRERYIGLVTGLLHLLGLEISTSTNFLSSLLDANGFALIVSPELIDNFSHIAVICPVNSNSTDSQDGQKATISETPIPTDSGSP